MTHGVVRCGGVLSRHVRCEGFVVGVSRHASASLSKHASSHGTRRACACACAYACAHLPERCEALVDRDALLEPQPLEARVLRPLRACEVDKVELRTERPAPEHDWDTGRG